MTESEFYAKISMAVMQVKTTIANLKDERIPNDEDYLNSSIGAYHSLGFEEYIGEATVVGITCAITSLAKHPVKDPVVAATATVFFMRQAWECYQKELGFWRRARKIFIQALLR